MNKRNLFLFLYLLLPILFIIPPVLAVPVANVTTPHGGEIFSGATIETAFTVSDSSKPQSAFDANLYYSYVSGNKENLIVADLNLFEYCDIAEGKLVTINTGFVKTGITATDLWTVPYESINLGVIDNNLVALVIKNVSDWSGWWWNESDSTWWASTGLETNLPHPVTSDVQGFTFFDYDSESYLLYVISDAGDRTAFSRIWNSTTEQWDVPATNFANGLDVLKDVTFREPNIVSFSGDLILFTDANSFVWDGSQWNPDNHWFSNFKSILSFGRSHTFFVDNDILKVITAEHEAVGAIFSTATGKWIKDTSFTLDINSTIDNTKRHNIAGINTYNNKMQVLVWEQTTNDYDAFEIFVSGYLTHLTSTCSYTWDISSVPNSSYYFDVAPFNSTSSGLGSSNRFEILKWTDSDVSCECISNCDSCVLDVNAFVVIPTNENNDVEIKIINSTTSKNIGYRIVNSKNTGKQYKIYTSADGSTWDMQDTLTFGTTNYDSIQKIWQQTTLKYHYSFSETLISDQTQYYKFEYYSPAYHWFTVNDSYWDIQSVPDQTDYNGLSTDVYGLSTKTDMTNFLTQPKFPAMTSDLSNKNFVFQFTAKGNTAFSGEFVAGTVINKETAPTTALGFLNRYRTTTITGIENGYLKMASSATTPRDLFIQNYVVTERGYFTRPLTLTSSDGSQLPILIGDNNTQSKYIIEGKDFMIHSQYNDPNGDIDRYEVTAYFTSVASGNKLKKWTFSADQNGLVPIREKVGGLVDLTPNADDLTVIITVRLIDSSANYYEIQTDKVILRQFPNTPTDLTFNVSQFSRKIGEYPKGRITIQTIAPENIIGVNLRFQDMTLDNNNADFNKVFYKDVDFTCNTFDCSFDYELDDYIFSTTGDFTLHSWVLVTTEEQDLIKPYNELLHDFLSFPVNWIAFNTARIFQTIERSDHTYRNDEVIPLVVQLMDSTGLPRTLQGRINVELQLEECDGNVDRSCRTIDLNYSPDSTLFDESTGYTYYHFRQLFVEEDYTRLSDGNYFRVKAFISDPTNTHEILYTPVLADKCRPAKYNLAVWFENMFNMNFFEVGCTEYTDEIVALPDNNSHEAYLLIDADHSVTAPTQFWWMCSSPDQNNLYVDVLAQDVVCFVWYLLGESPIDQFNFYLTNNNSDLVVTDNDLKQYIEMSVPYEYVYFNDLFLLKETLKQEFTTDWTAENPPTVAEAITYMLQHHLGALTPSINVAGDFLTASGLIGNIGFEMGAVESGNAIDFNFATPLDPRTVSGFLTYKISGINVINKKDYETKYPEIKNLSASKFTQWADMAGVRLKSDPITIDVFVSDHVKIMSYESNAKLIIDEIAEPNPINIANADANSDIKFESKPTKITFHAISDMIYNNGLTFKRRYLILPYTLVLTEETMCGWFGINCWGDDSSGSVVALIQEGDLSFFAVNAFGLFILLGSVLIFSVIYRNFRRRSVGG